VTWNFALSENELDVRSLPPANRAAGEFSRQVVVNIKPDGAIVLNKKTLSGPELLAKLKSFPNCIQTRQ